MNKKTIYSFLQIMCVLFFSLSYICFAETSDGLNIPDDVMNFYSQSINHLILSNNSFLLYSAKDNTNFYYLYYNPNNFTLNTTLTIQCISKKCPDSSKIKFDAIYFDEMPPFVKKAAGVYILTNDTTLGKFQYNLSIVDVVHNYSQSAFFDLEVISASFWKQFWYNLINLFS